ncbi:ABC transporter ATP-binding protein (plasmid) [Shinella sumterensis]|nr:ABC transporter ATP-binding protein [Shinella sumterensis]
MSETILSVENLRVEFETRRGTLVALDDISFSIAKGEVLGVVGESGAGKSMTGAAIMHLIPRPGHIAGGRILLDDRRIDNLDRTGIEAIRGRRIGMIFQDPLTSLNPLITVGDHLTETIRVHLPLNRRQARARAIELLEEVGIPDPAVRIDSYPHEFSGGQRQRVVIALALCAEPELVIADEPTTALDVSVQAQIIKLIRKLCSTRGTAFMLITHDMGMIAETADRVAVMYAGKVAEIGKVSQVVGAPLHPYAQGLMGAIPSLDNEEPRLRQIPGSMPSLTALPGGCSFHPRCERAMDICRQRAPALLGAIDHKVACHLYEREEVAA